MTVSVSSAARPLRVINSVAPIRICDNGGWTDTWFAGHGEVFNIGVYPYVEVQIAVFPLEDRQHRIMLYAENYGDRYPVEPGDHSEWDRHPLLEAAIEMMRIPDDMALQINVFSAGEHPSSTLTSASRLTRSVVHTTASTRASCRDPRQTSISLPSPPDVPARYP